MREAISIELKYREFITVRRALKNRISELSSGIAADRYTDRHLANLEYEYACALLTRLNNIEIDAAWLGHDEALQ